MGHRRYCMFAEDCWYREEFSYSNYNVHNLAPCDRYHSYWMRRWSSPQCAGALPPHDECILNCQFWRGISLGEKSHARISGFGTSTARLSDGLPLGSWRWFNNDSTIFNNGAVLAWFTVVDPSIISRLVAMVAGLLLLLIKDNYITGKWNVY